MKIIYKNIAVEKRQKRAKQLVYINTFRSVGGKILRISVKIVLKILRKKTSQSGAENHSYLDKTL